MEMKMEANDPVQITLTAQQWNVVIAALNDAPYRVAAPVIERILAQVKDGRPGGTTIEAAATPGNGHDKIAAGAS